VDLLVLRMVPPDPLPASGSDERGP